MKKGALYVLFAREPVPGKVKSRLASRIGPVAAARLYEALLQDVISCIRETKEPFAVAYTPESNHGYFSAIVPDALELLPQKGADLGERMKAVFSCFFEKGYERVIIVGTDIPLLTPGILEEADAALRENDVVIGQCRDGGYYLIGLGRPLPGLFEGIAWGGARVLQQTLALARSRGYRCYLTKPLFDVDRPEDLDQLSRELDLVRKRGLSLPEHTAREADNLWTESGTGPESR